MMKKLLYTFLFMQFTMSVMKVFSFTLGARDIATGAGQFPIVNETTVIKIFA